MLAPLGNELFPSNSTGVKRHHRQPSSEFASIFNHSNLRTNGSLPQLEKVQFQVMGDLHQALLGFVKALALYDGIGVGQRAFAAVTALLHRQEKRKKVCFLDSMCCLKRTTSATSG